MLTEEFLRAYFVSPEKLPKHPFYNRSVEITNALEAHSKGKYPKDIIEMVRPNETPEQKKYREVAFTPVTQTYFSKVVSTLGKIGRADDFEVKWKDDTKGPFKDKLSLQYYTESDFPYFDSILNWFFSMQLGEMCDDPNGVIAVFPLPKINPLDDAELLRPFSFWFESNDVIDYKEGEYCVVQSAEKSTIYVNNSPTNDGLVYYMFDQDSWTRCYQIGQKLEYSFAYDIQSHPVGYLPCFKVGGNIEEFKNGEMLYDSFIGDCLPFWNEALRRYSDLQVQMVLHVHSEKWEIEDTPCKVCGSSGMVNAPMGRGGTAQQKVACGNCNGTGCVSQRSPFGVKQIKPATKTSVSDSTPIPTPPMGYIDKPIDQSQFIKDMMQDNITSGLAAVHMEFLMSEPAVNSGVAKAIDKDEVNTFFYNVARHSINNILLPVYYICAKWRYGIAMSESDVEYNLPCIEVPTEFDIITENVQAQRLANAKNAGLSSSMISLMQNEYAEKVFGDDSTEAQTIIAISKLDPLPGKTEEEKMTILSNKGTSQFNYILSSNIQGFINQAIAKELDFLEMNYEGQIEILTPYVQDIIDNTEQKIVPIYINAPELDENGNPLIETPEGTKVSGSDDDSLKSSISQPVKQPIRQLK